MMQQPSSENSPRREPTTSVPPHHTPQPAAPLHAASNPSPFDGLTPPGAGGKVAEDARFFSPNLREEAQSGFSKMINKIPFVRDFNHLQTDRKDQSDARTFLVRSGVAILAASTLTTVATVGGLGVVGGAVGLFAAQSLFHGAAYMFAAKVAGCAILASYGAYLGWRLANAASDDFHNTAAVLNKNAAGKGSYATTKKTQEAEQIKADLLEKRVATDRENAIRKELGIEPIKGLKGDEEESRQSKRRRSREASADNQTQSYSSTDQGVGGNATGPESLDPLNKFGTGLGNKKQDDCK